MAAPQEDDEYPRIRSLCQRPAGAGKILQRVLSLASNQDREDEAQRILEALWTGKLDEHAAFERLYRTHFAAVRFLFRRWVSSSEDCDDLTQETFSRIYLSIGAFRGECSFSTFVRKVSRNVYLGYRRNKLAGKRSGIEIPLPEGEHDPGREPLPPAPATQEEELLRRERAQKVREAIMEMPEQRRKCLILKYHGGFTVREIAVLLKLADGTIKAHLHQAREQLPSLLDADLLEDFS